MLGGQWPTQCARIDYHARMTVILARLAVQPESGRGRVLIEHDPRIAPRANQNTCPAQFRARVGMSRQWLAL